MNCMMIYLMIYDEIELCGILITSNLAIIYINL
jgi:hypothetical protein